MSMRLITPASPGPPTPSPTCRGPPPRPRHTDPSLPRPPCPVLRTADPTMKIFSFPSRCLQRRVAKLTLAPSISGLINKRTGMWGEGGEEGSLMATPHHHHHHHHHHPRLDGRKQGTARVPYRMGWDPQGTRGTERRGAMGGRGVGGLTRGSQG